MEPISVYNKLITIPSDDFPFENIINGEGYKFREGSYRVLFYKYKEIMPTADTVLEEGDHLIVAGVRSAVEDTINMLTVCNLSLPN